MRVGIATLIAGVVLSVPSLTLAQNIGLNPPQTVIAGNGFSIPTAGNGKASLYIVGPGQAIQSDVQLGEAATFDAGVLHNAGRYLAILVGESATATGMFDVVPAVKPKTLSFLAKPSRLPVGLRDGISGTVYVFDAYRNLITQPMPVSFDLSNKSGTVQTRTVTSRNGVAWTKMDSSSKEGAAKFVAKVDGASSERIIEQVPGDPCGLTMSVRQKGKNLELQTAPVRDCDGNAVPDGTIVTFTQNYRDTQTTVDVPLKQGIARVEMPAHKGARISVASGVVAGNEIRWQ